MGTHFEVEGDWDIPSQDFILQFIGNGADKRCFQALKRQRLSDKSWEEFYAYTPSGMVSQFFLGAVKNSCQIARELATRRLGEVIAAFEKVPQQGLTIARREGAILILWEPLCVVEPHVRGTFTIRWSDLLPQKYSIDKDTATLEFQRLSSESMSGHRAVAARLATAQLSP